MKRRDFLQIGAAAAITSWVPTHPLLSRKKGLVGGLKEENYKISFVGWEYVGPWARNSWEGELEIVDLIKSQDQLKIQAVAGFDQFNEVKIEEIVLEGPHPWNGFVKYLSRRPFDVKKTSDIQFTINWTLNADRSSHET
jgi:hypothetical protein